MSPGAIKGLIYAASIGLGLLFGIWPGGTRRGKPAWWRWGVAAVLLLLVLAAFGIPMGGAAATAKNVGRARGADVVVPVYGTVHQLPSAVQGSDELVVVDDNGDKAPFVVAQGVDCSELKVGDRAILEGTYLGANDRHNDRFALKRVAAVNPSLVFPVVPGLEEQSRNLYFHVPSAWLSQLGWFVALWFGVRYLRRRDPDDDIRAATAAGIGVLFCVLAYLTGAFWALNNWGQQIQNWLTDPRLVSIYAVLLIYGAYFALRSALTNPEQRARISAVYLGLLALPIVFFVFVYPRLNTGLHPGSEGSENAGPLVSAQANAINPLSLAVFALAWFGFTLLFFWILNVSARTRLLARDLQRERLDASEPEAAVPTLRPVAR